ncbi:MAG: hypothetical protein EOO14_00320 [Chitinophagaceae bacterium]|nr:MAG: hypothetical protein EOO14_00320 [Chitinophagaceae bacterium]
MFIKLPNTKYNSRKKEWIDGWVLLNPFQIISIEKDDEDAKCCVVLCVSDVTYYIKLSPGVMQKRVQDFMEENVLTKIYSQQKDQQN